MNKELEALDRLTTFIGVYTEEQTQAVCKDIDLIKKSLKEWEIWKDALETGEYECPEKKALEIIKKKRVNVQFFIRCSSGLDYEEYKRMIEAEIYNAINSCSEFPLTQEEYDLLKEILL